LPCRPPPARLTAAQDPCPWARRRILKLLLQAHAATVSEPQIEHGGHTSLAGCFWPLLTSGDDLTNFPEEKQAIAGVAEALWALMNDAEPFDAPLRMLAHALWLVFWNIHSVGAMADQSLRPPELGSLEGWFDASTTEWDRDEKTMIHAQDFDQIGLQQQSIVEAREMEDKKARLAEGDAADEPGELGLAADAPQLGEDEEDQFKELFEDDDEDDEGEEAEQPHANGEEVL
jgi:hypothetical protein